MTVRTVLKMGDPRLLRIAPPVTHFDRNALRELVTDLLDTMHATDGVGIAAPQIGVDLQVVVFGFATNARYPEAPPVPKTVLINPTLTPIGDERDDGWEGCLSVPGLRGLVPRHRRLRYCGLDLQGQPFEREVDGFHARVVQHECDHLIGRLYPTRIADLTRFGFVDALFPAADGPTE